MQLLLRGTVAYLLFGAVFAAAYYEDPLQEIGDIGRAIPGSFTFFLSVGWWVVPLFAVIVVAGPGRALFERLPRAIIAVFLCSAFFLTFTMLKTSFPLVLPFWADPLFANLDKALHFGTDPWVVLHRIGLALSPDAANRIYLIGWLVPATYLPVLLFLFDGDEARIRRFIWLFFFVWVVVGTAMAMGFLSAGPIYYDRLLGGERFAGLLRALEDAGVTASSVGRTQERLWDGYSSNGHDLGSGISAFPSVHVAMVTLIALYAGERHWLWAFPGAALVGLFLYLSVYFGWHYAVDGYASILFVIAVWLVLRRRGAAM